MLSDSEDDDARSDEGLSGGERHAARSSVKSLPATGVTAFLGSANGGIAGGGNMRQRAETDGGGRRQTIAGGGADRPASASVGGSPNPATAQGEASSCLGAMNAVAGVTRFSLLLCPLRKSWGATCRLCFLCCNYVYLRWPTLSCLLCVGGGVPLCGAMR